MPYKGPFAVEYTNSYFAPAGISLFPIQAVEAAGDVLIVLFLLYYINHLQRKQGLLVYLMLYSTLRFVLEFFRFDQERGSIGVLSTSQVISLVILGGTAGYRIVKQGYLNKKRRSDS